MASAKQIKAQKLFAKRAKRGDFRKAIAKSKKVKTNPKRKTHTTYSKKQLEQRLKQLEQEVEYLKTAGFTNYNPTTMQSFGESKKEIKEISDELKREMRY
jgi:hypothetical protein